MLGNPIGDFISTSIGNYSCICMTDGDLEKKLQEPESQGFPAVF